MVDRFTAYAVFTFLLLVSSPFVLAYSYTATGNGFTISDSDTECTSTTCVVKPLVCNDRALLLNAVSVAVDFEVIEPTKLAVDGRDLVYAPIDSIVAVKEAELLVREEAPVRGEITVTEPVLEASLTKTRYAIEAPRTFQPLECVELETTIRPVFGGQYKYSVFANGFELDPLVNATRYEIGFQTASNWTVDRLEASTTVTLVAADTILELPVINS